ncbi:YfcE family phosphodiesterase [Mycoplasmatota bacterium]|nr:YfcE family phosphodiesterase [Mycoplasmatota bacterium]
MKILLFSDTHGDLDAYKEMIGNEEKQDHIFCLGDSGFNLDFLNKEKIVSVKGNYPFSPKLPYDISEKINDFWFFFTHGHLYHVKFGLSKIMNKACLLKMDVCCFGHTHKMLLTKKNELILLNPGALSYTRSHLFPSYARIFIEGNKMILEIVNLKTKKVVEKLIEVK